MQLGKLASQVFISQGVLVGDEGLEPPDPFGHQEAVLHREYGLFYWWLRIAAIGLMTQDVSTAAAVAPLV